MRVCARFYCVMLLCVELIALCGLLFSDGYMWESISGGDRRLGHLGGVQEEKGASKCIV